MSFSQIRGTAKNECGRTSRSAAPISRGTRIRDRVGGLLDDFTARIDAAVAAGEARPVDAGRLTRYLWGAWNGVIGLSLQPDGLRLAPDEVAETLELGRWLLREGLATAALRGPDGTVGDRVALPRV
ncbi:hypothetical protein HX744_19745 [Pseudonocardia sp. ICBG1122]|nr:hypothetical protein [Pseudonocardia pini]